ncbi:hypothetical protein HNR03_000233 [Pseudomonas sp. JAI111]|nr:hypothetical protein [Pseudomonas sp. JAI111]MCS3835653.1 hypothetical protein [Pseudomonas sp. JAI111]
MFYQALEGREQLCKDGAINGAVIDQDGDVYQRIDFNLPFAGNHLFLASAYGKDH